MTCFNTRADSLLGKHSNWFSLLVAVLTVSASFVFSVPAHGAQWQWSIPDGQARAYLWIPPTCKRVRAVVVANHNMIEQGILEHPTMRETLSELGMAEVWVVPGMDISFDFNKGAGEQFGRIINGLADESGYTELRNAPVVTLGHSANATWPWNFAAWNPNRTLAVLSVHGDAPQTNLTGYGRANVDWGERTIDGVPGLMVMSEYEWGEVRLTPAMDFRSRYPGTPLAFLGDAGQCHFDYSDQLVSFLAMFIRKSVYARLPQPDAGAPLDQIIKLKPIDPTTGWLVDRWRKDERPAAPSAPYKKYKGDRKQAFWCFDKEMARATEKYYASARGKKPQLVSVTDGTASPEKGVGEPVTPHFIPAADGVSFRLKTAYMDSVPDANSKATLWTGLPGGAPLGHAAGPIFLSKIVGPAVQTSPDTFAIHFGRAEFTADRRNHDIWILAGSPGDKTFKSAVQQAMVHFEPNLAGVVQHIDFPAIPDQTLGTKTLRLQATSDAGIPVAYYVVDGPAEVEGDMLRFTPIPPRAKFPLKVTVVAWQWGRSASPQVQTAESVTREFLIIR